MTIDSQKGNRIIEANNNLKFAIMIGLSSHTLINMAEKEAAIQAKAKTPMAFMLAFCFINKLLLEFKICSGVIYHARNNGFDKSNPYNLIL